ncbi:MAG: cytochrome P450 [Actinobacteria bacterium]|nr:cytochrome P450 [Actinomycetota bacterium]
MEDIHEFIEHAIGGDVRDPYPEFARKRALAPVHKQVGFDGRSTVYGVYTYEAISEVLRHPETFSSRVYAPAIGMVFGPSILQMDGTEHHSHRALIGGSFRRTALEGRIASLIEPTVHELIDGFVARGHAELVREFTFRYPIRIIARLLGLPTSDYDRFARLSIELISIATNIEKGLAASEALRDYFSTVLLQKRTARADDLISDLAFAEIDGERLSDEEIVAFLRLLLTAGVETTYRLLGTLLLALLREPAQLALVAKDRSLITAAIEEALRWEAPVQTITREPVKDVELAGVSIPESAHVTLWLGSANHDETVFDDPDRFDVHRDGPGHLAFAEGPHRCVGEHLARVETTVAMNGLLDRLGDIELEPGEWDPHVRGIPFRSPNAVPVRFTPA